ncbi:MAG: WecB/TagA/CpsF family glycosyltransferase, partial [Candidatus Cloacimonadota bacterium]|nr:WecB/TagA/CpsF family glycosyltransferase [Candidatus Cloacimonadota bacterium]
KAVFENKYIFGKKAEKTKISYFNITNSLLRSLALFYYVILGKLSLTGIGITEYDRNKREIGDYYIYRQKPGIFNLWYIRESSRTAYEGKLGTELEYVYTTNYLKDILLLLKTIPAFVYNPKADVITDNVELFGIKLLNIKMQQAVELVEQIVDSNKKEEIFFVNPHCLNKIFKDISYYRILRKAKYIFPDGIGINIAAKMLHNPLVENLNGTDLLPFLCEIAVKKGYKLYFLGGKPGIAEKAKEKLKEEYSGLKIVGIQDGYFKEDEIPQIIESINDTKTDILLVAMGVPKQEKWIANYFPDLQVNIAMGVGGLFDFYSGNIKRAPRWMREIGLEWFFRLLQEPKRMWKRYIIGNPLFLIRVIKWKLAKQNRMVK